MNLPGEHGKPRPHTQSPSPGLSPGRFYYLHAGPRRPQFGSKAAFYFSLSARWRSAFETRHSEALSIVLGAGEHLPRSMLGRQQNVTDGLASRSTPVQARSSSPTSAMQAVLEGSRWHGGGQGP